MMPSYQRTINYAPQGSALLSENKYNDQNIKIKFDGMKFKMNFKETPINITNIRVLTKSKAFLEKYQT